MVPWFSNAHSKTHWCLIFENTWNFFRYCVNLHFKSCKVMSPISYGGHDRRRKINIYQLHNCKNKELTWLLTSFTDKSSTSKLPKYIQNIRWSNGVVYSTSFSLVFGEWWDRNLSHFPELHNNDPCFKIIDLGHSSQGHLRLSMKVLQFLWNFHHLLLSMR